MSKLVESLKSQLKVAFGDDFGTTVTESVDLVEAVEYALAERRDDKMPIAKRGIPKAVPAGFSPTKSSKIKKKKSNKTTVAPFDRAGTKAHKAVADMHRKTDADRSQRGMDDFFSHANREGAKSANKPRPRGVASGTEKHNPFKRSDSLGHGPGTPPGFKGHGAREHNEKHCWHCKCHDIYSKQGCTCIGTGATPDCPKGHEKTVHIKHAYRQAYNKEYHRYERDTGPSFARKAKLDHQPQKGDNHGSRLARRGA